MNTSVLPSPAPALTLGQTEAVLDHFAVIERRAGGQQPRWLLPLRKAGLARFAELGFPASRQTDWKHTPLQDLARWPFRPVVNSGRYLVPAALLRYLPWSDLGGNQLVFVDGHYSPALSRVTRGEAALRITPLSAALSSEPRLIEPHLARYSGASTQPFTALNTAFFTDGALVRAPAGEVVAEPIRLVFVSTGQRAGDTMHVRNLILAEPHSQLTVTETYIELGPSRHLTNSVVELVLAEGAVVEHCQLQDANSLGWHLHALHAQVERGASLLTHSLVWDTRWSRNDLRVDLIGAGAEATLNGLYCARQDHLVDHHLLVEHTQPHTTSHEFFNGILANNARGVFHGRILIRPGAQKTDAKQTNKHLLLSKGAAAASEPQLEIYADDVKCTHGATAGQLSDESLFYLRARGLGLEQARRLLIHAFAAEILDRVRHPALREELERLAWARMDALGKAAGP